MINSLPSWLPSWLPSLLPSFIANPIADIAALFRQPVTTGNAHTGSGPLGIWREISLGGAYVPTLMVLFLGCIAVTWAIDQLLGRAGAYRFIWHPPLFRVSLFACLLSSVALLLYG